MIPKALLHVPIIKKPLKHDKYLDNYKRNASDQIDNSLGITNMYRVLETKKIAKAKYAKKLNYKDNKNIASTKENTQTK